MLGLPADAPASGECAELHRLNLLRPAVIADHHPKPRVLPPTPKIAGDGRSKPEIRADAAVFFGRRMSAAGFSSDIHGGPPITEAGAPGKRERLALAQSGR